MQATIRSTKKKTLKIYHYNELQTLIETIADKEGFSVAKLVKKQRNLTAIDAQTMLDNLVEIAWLGQTALIQFPLTQEQVDKLHAAVNIPYCNNANLRLVKQLNKQPVLLQLMIIMHTNYIDPNVRAWLKIAIYLAIAMKGLNKKSYYKALTVRFKLALIRSNPVYSWLYKALPTITVTTDARFKVLIARFIQLSKTVEAPEASKNRQKERKQKRNQASKIASYLEIIFGKNDKKAHSANLATPEQTAKPHRPTHKPIRIAGRPPTASHPFIASPIVQDDDLLIAEPQDSENTLQGIQLITPAPPIPIDIDEPLGYEEYLDNLEPPIFSNQAYQNSLYAQSIPLQIKEMTVQQQNISLREQGLVAHTAVLSPTSYQEVFTQFVHDAKLYEKTDPESCDVTKTCASLFLLAMLTASPVNALANKTALKDSGLFDIKPRKSWLTFSLGITRPKRLYNKDKFENEFDKVELPIPSKLLNYLLAVPEMPTSKTLQQYLSDIKVKLGITYLSKGRIESALQTILKFYIKSGNSHIAELISRVPLSQSVANFYSSHDNDNLIHHYRLAIEFLNQDNVFDTTYLQAAKNFTTGSGYALTINFVKDILVQFKAIVLGSQTRLQLFNHYSAYIWFIFCLLTGIRPNNQISPIHDIDIEAGWLIINDKDNRSVKNHRLIPLCPLLIQHINHYQAFLSDFRHHYIDHPIISQKIAIVIFQLKHDGDDCEHQLLNFIADNANQIMSIKRGQVATILQPILDLSVYWTRHFVRTQLEKRQVPMPIINQIIGHERHLQEGLGGYSTLSKADIKRQTQVFDEIAMDIGLAEPLTFANQVSQQLRAMTQ